MFDYKRADITHHMNDQVVPLLDRAADRVDEMANQSVDTVRKSTQALRSKALHMSEGTVNYIRDKPVKAMLMAAATGLALMSLFAFRGRSRR